MMNTIIRYYCPGCTSTNQKWITVLLVITLVGILTYTSDFTNNYYYDGIANDRTKSQQISIQDSTINMKKEFYTARDKIVEKLQLQYGSDLFHKMFVIENDDTINSNNNNNHHHHQRFRTLFDDGLSKYINPLNGSSDDNNINDKVYNDKYMSSFQSYNRMVRKVMKKIIQAQMQPSDKKTLTPSATQSTTTTLQSANANSMFLESKEIQQHEQNDPIDDNNNNINSIESTIASLIPFIWATAGNSVAAGHGNLYNETYSAVVERNLQSMFHSVFNMNLIVRNYGVSAMASGPEASLCLNEIYGTDIDLLIWHFGLTDDKRYHNLALFLYRSLLHRNHPSVWALQVDGNVNGKNRRNVIQVLDEQYKLSVLTMNGTVFNYLQDCIPDSFGLSDDEINLLPEYVRNFRCGSGIESGDPYCENERFSSYHCPDRAYRVSWHPGWKWDALLGNLATFTLLQVFEDAIIEIEKYTNTVDDNANLLYETLLQEEQDAFEIGIEQTPPVDLLRPFIDETMINDTTLSFLAQSQSICRTGLYPSESRLKAIVQLNNNNERMLTSIDEYSNTNLSSSVPVQENWEITTGYIADFDCKVPTAIDHRDYYRVHSDDSWKTLVLPSQSEMNVYFHKLDASTSITTLSSSSKKNDSNKNETKKLHGYIALCTMVYCHSCPKGLLQRTALYDGSVSIQVNGIIVTNFTKFSDCDFLYHDISSTTSSTVEDDSPIVKQQSMVFPANENGQYEISVKVNAQSAYYPISSIVLW